MGEFVVLQTPYPPLVYHTRTGVFSKQENSYNILK